MRHHNVVEFLNTNFIIPYHLNPEDRVVDWLLDEASRVTSHKLAFLGYAAFFYAALFFAEGIGLYLRKRWAEYLVVIVTGSLLPLEVYELYLGLAIWKFAAVVGNLAIVSYLVHRLMLDSRNRNELEALFMRNRRKRLLRPRQCLLVLIRQPIREKLPARYRNDTGRSLHRSVNRLPP